MDLHRLLYVEDEPDIRAVAEIALKDVGGFELSMCERGEDAVATALRVRPQLIMLDVMMPGLDGITTFRRLREQPQLSGIPVVFLTAKAQKQEVASLMALGAAGVIAKPFEPLTLAGEVRRFWLAHGGD